MFENKMYISFTFCDKDDIEECELTFKQPLYVDEFSKYDMEVYIEKVWKYLHKAMCKDLDKKYLAEKNDMESKE